MGYVYTQDSGLVAYSPIWLVVPEITEAEFATQVEVEGWPQDPWHEAFEIDTVNSVVVSNVPKLKEWAHGRRRAKRMVEFEPHDDTIKLQVPGQDMAAAEAARATIRTADAGRQTAIDGCVDEAALRAVIEVEQL